MIICTAQGGILEYIGTGIVVAIGNVLDGNGCRGRDHAVVVARAPAVIVGVGVTPVGGEDIVEVEDDYVAVGIVSQPIVDQPVVKGAGIFRIGLVHHGGGGDHHEKLVLPRLKVFQEVVVDALGVANGVIWRRDGLSTQWVITSRRRIVRISLQVRVRIAGLEHNDFVLATGVGHWTGVVGVLVGRVVQGAQIGTAARTAKPAPPVPNVCIRTDAIGSPIVISVADVVVVVPQCGAQVTIAVVEPVVSNRMVDED